MKKGVGEEVLLETIIFILTIIFIATFWSKNILLAFTLFALYLVGNLFWHKKYDYIYYLTGLIVGPVAEIVATYFGAWTYANPTILNIPIWLPFAWGLATVMIIRIAQTIIKIAKD